MHFHVGLWALPSVSYLNKITTPALSNALVVLDIELFILSGAYWGDSPRLCHSVHPSLLLGRSLSTGVEACPGLPIYSAFVWRSHPLSFGHEQWGTCAGVPPFRINLYIGNGENWVKQSFCGLGEFRKWVMQAEPDKMWRSAMTIGRKTLEAVTSHPLNSAMAP